MTYKEIYGNLFDLPDDCILAHCISADFALGAGIAAQFTAKGVRDELFSKYAANIWVNEGYCLMTNNTPFKVANLVTKEKCYYKPTLKSVAEALISFRDQLTEFPVKIGMPCIGSGLDRLKWEDVKDIVKSVFEDVDCEIIVCKLA